MKHVPQRSCIVCRAQKDKSDLIRIVRLADGSIAADETGKMSGRGSYVCRSKECAANLIKKHALDRAFKTKVSQETYAALAERLTELVGGKDE